MVDGKIFEADMQTLKQWIAEGQLLPTDKVRKGDHGWVDANLAPVLRRLFLGQEPLPPVPENKDATPPSQPDQAAMSRRSTALPPAGGFSQPGMAAPAATASPALNTACHNHPDIAPHYVCRVCGATFCEQCPKFVGTSKIALCPLCGDLCILYQNIVQKAQHKEYQSSGFGFADFKLALLYPLRDKLALLLAAMFYGFLLIAGFKGKILAYVILFGCISLVIRQVADGKQDRGFMPDFGAFSWWDDVLAPIGLGIAIFIVTLGPTILLVLALLFGWLSGPRPSALSGIHMPEGQGQSQLTREDLEAVMNGNDPKKDEAVAQKFEQLKRPQVLPQPAGAESDSSMAMNFLRSCIGSPGAVVLLLFLSLGWAVFYYPMALAVAGYSQEFRSVINPLVGLNTIWHMGAVYVKVFVMYLGVEIIGLGVSIVIAMVTAPFNLPFVGNLPGRFMDGMVTFYVNLVIAFLLGLSLYKCADKLDLQVD